LSFRRESIILIQIKIIAIEEVAVFKEKTVAASALSRAIFPENLP
jgi:hypothetical protein